MLSPIFSPLLSVTNKDASAINLVTMENTAYKWEAMHHANVNQHLELSTKRNGTQKRTKVSHMMRAFYVLRYAKRHMHGTVTLHLLVLCMLFFTV